MDFIVEDGTGVTNANTYVSLADALKYHENMGNSAWAQATDPARQIALVRASSYLDGQCASSWPGSRCSSTQGLDWPRDDAEDIDGFELTGVPKAVKEAICDAALIELEQLGTLDAPPDNPGQVLSERIEGLVTITYAKTYSSGGYPIVYRKLARIINNSAVRDIIK